MNGEVNELTVSIGPCISQENYEVKNDFYTKFKQKSDSYE